MEFKVILKDGSVLDKVKLGVKCDSIIFVDTLNEACELIKGKIPKSEKFKSLNKTYSHKSPKAFTTVSTSDGSSFSGSNIKIKNVPFDSIFYENKVSYGFIKYDSIATIVTWKMDKVSDVDKLFDDLRIASKPLVDFINTNYDPMTKVIISDSNVEVLRCEVGIVNEVID